MKNKALILTIIGMVLAGTAVFNTAYGADQNTPSQKQQNGNMEQRQNQGIMGTVTAINGTTITMTSRVNGPNQSDTTTTYTVDASSATITKNGETSSVSAIAVNDNIVVEGTTNGTTITAKTIKIGMGQMIDKDATKGTVTAIGGNTITMTGKTGGQPTKNTDTAQTTTTYTIDASKATITEDGTSSTLSAIVVGDIIMVKGTTTGTSIAATSIAIQNNQGQQQTPSDSGEPVVTGTITAINGTTITVKNTNNIVYTIDASSAKITKKNKESTISSVAVGDNIIVQGTFNGTTVTATTIVDQGVKKANFFTNIFNAFRKFFKF